MENTAEMTDSREARRLPWPQPLWLLSSFAAFLVLISAGCARQERPADEAASDVKPAQQDISQQVENFTFSSVGEDGVSDWQLEGEAANITEDKVDLQNVKIKSKGADASVTMEAKRGTIKKYEDVGIFKEDVVLAYDDGTTVSTDEVNWFFKKQVAKTDSPVLVKSGGLETKAEGACLRKDINRIQLNKDILMNTDSGTTIRCKGPLVMDYKKNIAVFNKDVSVDNAKGRMTSNKMVVLFDSQKKSVERIDAVGNVRLARGNSVSVSEKVTYFSKEGRAVLTGNPVVYFDAEEARAIAER